jgi:hypothetical protein
MLAIYIERNRLHIGERFSVSFQRTLRLPDDSTTYPLPPGLGLFPMHRVEDFIDSAPKFMTDLGGIFIPMYQREAMWLGFDAAPWKPNAVKIAVGRVNAVSGEPWDEFLHDQPQDYLVCPDQPWLDGINAGPGYIRQFVAVPLGMGYTVEGQVTGEETWGGLQIQVFEPKPGKFPDEPPPEPPFELQTFAAMAPQEMTGAQMGFGAGGRMTQKIYPDRFGIETWDQNNFGSVFVHIVNSEQYYKITGAPPPPTPIDAATYVEMELPWFELYDEQEADLEASKKLAAVKSIHEKDQAARVINIDNEKRLDIKPSQVVGIDRTRKNHG